MVKASGFDPDMRRLIPTGPAIYLFFNPLYYYCLNKFFNHEMPDFENLKIFSGNSNKELSKKIANKIGIPIGKAFVGRFSDGEVQVELHEDVRGKDVFVIQSTCNPTNENLMELLIMVDALKGLLLRESQLLYLILAIQDKIEEHDQ